jgi:hypothetical protein
MRIAVVEIDYHSADLDGFCRTFEKDNFDIAIFTTKAIFERLNQEAYVNKFKWVINETSSIRRFLLLNKTLIDSYDLIYFNTLASQYKTILKCNFSKRTILRIHNANTYFKPASNFFVPTTAFFAFKIASYLMREYFIKGHWYALSRAVSSMDYYVFPDKNIQEYVSLNEYCPKEKILPFIPGSVNSGLFPMIYKEGPP